MLSSSVVSGCKFAEPPPVTRKRDACCAGSNSSWLNMVEIEIGCCPRRLERRLRGFPRRCLSGWRIVPHRDSVHAPSPRIAATDGFGAVHAPNLLAARIDDLIILARPAAIAPIDAPQLQTHRSASRLHEVIDIPRVAAFAVHCG
jgi:hypothetical protein